MQTKQAMATILSELRDNDFFNIITFSDTIRIWKTGGTVKAIRSNVHDAQEFVKKITAEGCRCKRAKIGLGLTVLIYSIVMIV